MKNIIKKILQKTLDESDFYGQKYDYFPQPPEKAKLKLKIPMEPVYIDVNNNMWRLLHGKVWLWEGQVFVEYEDNK